MRENSNAWELVRTERHWPPDRLHKEDLGGNIGILRSTFNEWAARAESSPDGFIVGDLNLYVQNTSTSEIKRIVFSITLGDVYITLE